MAARSFSCSGSGTAARRLRGSYATHALAHCLVHSCRHLRRQRAGRRSHPVKHAAGPSNRRSLPVVHCIRCLHVSCNPSSKRALSGVNNRPTARRGLTPRSRRGPTALHLAREALWFIMRLAGQAQHRRSRLNSNVRPRRKSIVVNLLASETRQKTEDAGAPQGSRAVLHPGLLGTLHKRSSVRRRGQSFAVQASIQRRAGELLGGAFKPPPSCRNQRLEWAAMLHGRVGAVSAPGSLLLAPEPQASFSSAAAPWAQAATAQRGLTRRSSRRPTALRLAREAPWYMMRLAGQAQYRRSRLNSNVRHRLQASLSRINTARPSGLAWLAQRAHRLRHRRSANLQSSCVSGGRRTHCRARGARGARCLPSYDFRRS